MGENDEWPWFVWCVGAVRGIEEWRVRVRWVLCTGDAKSLAKVTQ